MNRKQLGDLIFDSLDRNRSTLESQYKETKDGIGYFYIDNLLPKEIALEIHNAFPQSEKFVSKKNIREYKHVGVQMDEYNPILEEITYAFQSQKVVDIISEICGLEGVLPDKNLYAGGLSMMKKDNFLHPHLDNSHDKSMELFRVFNLLFYVTPEWTLDCGGNLELWPDGLEGKPKTIVSKFNRLVVMATHKKSWHSVSKVVKDEARLCVSNYYFSQSPLDQQASFHITTFRGRPESKMSDFLLRSDSWIRSSIRKIFPKGIKENKHYYKRKD